MTTVADFLTKDTDAHVPVRSADGGRMLVCAAQRLSGVALLLAAMGLWFAPGAAWESDVMLFKLILSLTAVLAGLGLMQSSATPNIPEVEPEVEIDTIRREVRFVRHVNGGENHVLRRCGFTDLGRVERDGMHLRMWDSNNVLLVNVSLTDHTKMISLMSGLRAAGKIA